MNRLKLASLHKFLFSCFLLTMISSVPAAAAPIVVPGNAFPPPQKACPAYGVCETYRLWRIGCYVGYASAFARVDEQWNGGTITTLPGFEGALFFQRNLTRKLYFQVGAGYVSRNFRVSAGGSAFGQRNDRLFLPVQFVWRPFLVNDARWLKRIGFIYGAQADFAKLYVPAGSRIDAATSAQLTGLTNKKPEILATAGIVKQFTPIGKFDHAIAVSYSFGLVKTAFGQISQPGQKPFSWQNSGSYLSVKYIFWLTRSGRVETRKPHPHNTDSF